MVTSQSVWQLGLQLCRRWWNSDRVRITPQAGTLWRLRHGSLLTIDGQTLEVLSRRSPDEAGNVLEFVCNGADGVGVLRLISIPHPPYVRLFWRTTDDPRELSMADVQIWRTGDTLEIGDHS